MKKSELRKLIRESIKNLVNEQMPSGVTGPNWQQYFDVWGGSGQPPITSPLFLDNMSQLGCDGRNRRLNILYNKLYGTDPTASTQPANAPGGLLNTPSPGGGVYGSNPAWQSKLMAKIMWIMNNNTPPNCDPTGPPPSGNPLMMVQQTPDFSQDGEENEIAMFQAMDSAEDMEDTIADRNDIPRIA